MSVNNDADTLCKQANVLIQQGELSKASQLLSKLLDTVPNHIDGLRLRGMLAVKQGDFPTAIDYFQQAIRYTPEQHALYNDLGLSLVHQQQFKQAELIYLKAIKKYEDNPQEGVDSDNKQLQIEKQNTYAEICNNLASLYYKLTQFNQAKLYYQKAISTHPDYLAAHYNLGLIYTKLDQFNNAINQFQTVVSLSPTHGKAHFHLANLLAQTNQLTEAQQHYQLAIEQQPTLVNAYANLAAIHVKQHQLTNAQACYQTALELEPNSSSVHFNMGVILAEQNNITDAIEHYQQTITLQPDHLDALQNLAVCYYKQHNTDMAIACYEKALTISPENPALSYLLSAIKQDGKQQTTPIVYIKKLFDDYANDYDNHLQTLLCYQIPILLTQLIEKTVMSQSPCWDILDLGCGTGLMGSKIKPYAHYLLGIDVAISMLKKAEEKQIYDQLTCTDIKTFIEQCDTMFDLIIAADVFGYIGNLDRLFHRLAQLLKPSGMIAFSIELTEEPCMQLQPTGRFQHNMNYIQQLTQQNQLTIIAKSTETIRLQQGLPVNGALFLLGKIA